MGHRAIASSKFKRQRHTTAYVLRRPVNDQCVAYTTVVACSATTTFTETEYNEPKKQPKKKGASLCLTGLIPSHDTELQECRPEDNMHQWVFHQLCLELVYSRTTTRVTVNKYIKGGKVHYSNIYISMTLVLRQHRNTTTKALPYQDCSRETSRTQERKHLRHHLQTKQVLEVVVTPTVHPYKNRAGKTEDLQKRA